MLNLEGEKIYWIELEIAKRLPKGSPILTRRTTMPLTGLEPRNTNTKTSLTQNQAACPESSSKGRRTLIILSKCSEGRLCMQGLAQTSNSTDLSGTCMEPQRG